jgi:hypothetical protein
MGEVWVKLRNIVMIREEFREKLERKNMFRFAGR